MKNYLLPVLATGLFLSQIHASQAVIVTFAQINLPSNSTFNLTPTLDPTTGVYVGSTFTGTDNSLATFFFSNSSGSVPLFQATPFGAQNPINANFSLLATTSFNSPAGTTGLTGASQEFEQQTFAITARGNQVVNGINIANGTNLLTETITTGIGLQAGQISGTVNTTNPNFSGGDVTVGNPNFRSNVTFTSAFINFTGANSKGFSFGTSSATPAYNIADDGFGDLYIQGFNAAGVGTFNAQFPAVPEPGSIALLIGMGVSGSAFFLRRRRK